MHLYLHLLSGTPEVYSEAEEAQLRQRLATVPGITAVMRVERHPRGGYSVRGERSGDLTPILEHLAAHGYRSVI